MTLVTTQLKFEQFENYFRILNVFVKGKNLEKLDSILLLSSSTVSSSINEKISLKTNALKALINTKFVAIKLLYQTSTSLTFDSNNELTNLLNNEQELKQIIHSDLCNFLNNFLTDAMHYSKANNTSTASSTLGTNQISKYLVKFE